MPGPESGDRADFPRKFKGRIGVKGHCGGIRCDNISRGVGDPGDDAALPWPVAAIDHPGDNVDAGGPCRIAQDTGPFDVQRIGGHQGNVPYNAAENHVIDFNSLGRHVPPPPRIHPYRDDVVGPGFHPAGNINGKGREAALVFAHQYAVQIDGGDLGDRLEFERKQASLPLTGNGKMAAVPGDFRACRGVGVAMLHYRDRMGQAHPFKGGLGKGGRRAVWDIAGRKQPAVV